jgi:signal transduction histidine kinase
LLAAVFLVALEVSVLVGSHRRGPLIVNVIVVAGMALVAIWRRRSPLALLIVVGALVTVLEGWLTSLNDLPLVGIYITLVPTYTVAAWEERRGAVLGLVIFICGTAVSNALVAPGTIGDFVGGAFTVTAAWGAGRAIRARHAVTSELKRRSGRLVAEREDRALLAVAGERSRIAREMHAAVAQTVAGMVVQAEAARRLLGREPAQAETALGAIEQAGRQTLVEMRRLGVLRYADDASELAPQPGVDQIYALIERARDGGQPIELSVDGDPGTLPPGVDLGIYRILEEALKSVRRQQGAAVGCCPALR